ncbi:sarcosine oxidase subunit gamma [Lutimaribacter marinistellae]|uniref:Sarcosine oxidase subunit gamma n=1 Tax=Lutimaribacter marinistellae TaxID=1820329 RepID=A0ABV7TPK8_9RHOB
MSDARSALMKASFDGIARVEECGLQGMITLRGDLGSELLAKAVKDAVGQDVPGIREAKVNGSTGVIWMSPDELLLLVPYGKAGETCATLAEALKGEHALAVNVSDARALFRISGAPAREVMGKLAPVDFAPGAFEPGQIRRSRMAQVPAAFWMDDAETFRVICFRSVADYVFKLLKTAAVPGSSVGYFG